jgi:hypothetical protein
MVRSSKIGGYRTGTEEWAVHSTEDTYAATDWGRET